MISVGELKRKRLPGGRKKLRFAEFPDEFFRILRNFQESRKFKKLSKSFFSSESYLKTFLLPSQNYSNLKILFFKKDSRKFRKHCESFLAGFLKLQS